MLLMLTLNYLQLLLYMSFQFCIFLHRSMNQNSHLFLRKLIILVGSLCLLLNSLKFLPEVLDLSLLLTDGFDYIFYILEQIISLLKDLFIFLAFSAWLRFGIRSEILYVCLKKCCKPGLLIFKVSKMDVKLNQFLRDPVPFTLKAGNLSLILLLLFF